MRLLFVLALAACTPKSEVEDSAAPEDDPLSWPLDAPGPFAVGYQQWPITYAPTPGNSRDIVVNVWYPTEADDGDDLLYAGFAPAMGTLGNAALAPSAHDAGYPVVAYSHGDQGYGGTSFDLMIWFASHGWIAVAPDHTDNLLIANVDPSPPAHHAHRAHDVVQSVDALSTLDGFDAADTSQWLMTGHSRGATTVWSLLGATYDPSTQDDWCAGCTSDELALFDAIGDDRIVGAIPMAGTLRRSYFGAAGHQSVQVPVLAMTGTDDAVGQQQQFDEMDTVDFTWIDLEGGCHQSFALGACSTLDVAEGYRIIDTYALALGRHLLLGDMDENTVGILDGSIEVDARVHYARK
jgi:predicted dienelactone hydrolase